MCVCVCVCMSVCLCVCVCVCVCSDAQFFAGAPPGMIYICCRERESTNTRTLSVSRYNIHDLAHMRATSLSHRSLLTL